VVHRTGGERHVCASRFEPCGLTQQYGLRYGTVPLVRRVGGLADTVVNAETGFVFDDATPFALQACFEQALVAYRTPSRWHAIMRAGMAQALDWDGPAQRYLELYASAIDARRRTPRLPPGP
jgi:starch synthase